MICWRRWPTCGRQAVTKLASDRVSLGRPRLVVPAYFRPDVRPGDWDMLAKHASQVRLVILNLANGRRPGREALDDLGLFLRWYDVAGVCFDRAAGTAEHLGYYAALSRYARDMGARVVLFNHGAHPLEAYAEHANLLGTFEGPWRAYLQLAVPRWTRSRPADKFCHVVHSVPPENYDHAFLLAMRRRAGSAYITDRRGSNPYDCLPAGGLEPESRWMR